jgi:menaquinone-dependent protoporphyrinogen oxidase
VTAMRAPVGDFRDWTAVRAWAEEIATALQAGSGR